MRLKAFILLIGLLSICSNGFAQGMTIDSSGKVVIGDVNYSAGIVFPDGTLQITAASGGSGGSGGIYFGVAVVAKAGGDYVDPISAMNDIAIWCGTPSSTNPCLLQIMPGIYDIGTNNLQMQEYVDIAGSGENVTRIRGNRDYWPGVVAGSDNVEIRFITVENTGGGNFAFGIISYSTSPKVTNVTAIAAGATEQLAISCEANCTSVMTNVTAIASGGVAALGFYIDDGASPTLINARAFASGSNLNLAVDLNNNASPSMTNLTAVATGGTNSHALHFNGASTPFINNATAIASGSANDNFAVYIIEAASPVMTNLKADASGGANNYAIYAKTFVATGGTVKLDHSVIKGTTNAVYADATYTVQIGGTRIDGSVTGPGSYICAGVYNENYTFYSGPNCP